jgi:hypothetical protein
MARYGLPVDQQLPGESSGAFGNRTGAVQAPPGVDQNGQPVQPPLDTSGQPLGTSGQAPGSTSAGQGNP